MEADLYCIELGIPDFPAGLITLKLIEASDQRETKAQSFHLAVVNQRIWANGGSLASAPLRAKRHGTDSALTESNGTPRPTNSGPKVRTSVKSEIR